MHHRAKWTNFFKDLIKSRYEFLTFYAFLHFLRFVTSYSMLCDTDVLELLRFVM
jgi:hypothetical protein